MLAPAAETVALPRYVEFRDALPRTETGRVQKYLLRADDGSYTAATLRWDEGAGRLSAMKAARMPRLFSNITFSSLTAEASWSKRKTANWF